MYVPFKNHLFHYPWKAPELRLRLKSATIPHSRNYKGNLQAFSVMTSEIVWVDKHYCWLVNGCLEHHWPIIAIANVHPNNPRNGCNERLHPSFWSRDRNFVELRLSWVFPYPTFLNTLWFNVIIIIAEAPRNIAFFTLKIMKQKFVLMGRSKLKW